MKISNKLMYLSILLGVTQITFSMEKSLLKEITQFNELLDHADDVIESIEGQIKEVEAQIVKKKKERDNIVAQLWNSLADNGGAIAATLGKTLAEIQEGAEKASQEYTDIAAAQILTMQDKIVYGHNILKQKHAIRDVLQKRVHEMEIAFGQKVPRVKKAKAKKEAGVTEEDLAAILLGAGSATNAASKATVTELSDAQAEIMEQIEPVKQNIANLKKSINAKEARLAQINKTFADHNAANEGMGLSVGVSLTLGESIQLTQEKNSLEKELAEQKAELENLESVKTNLEAVLAATE